MSTLRVSPVSLGFCSRHSWILSPTPAQRTQRTHHPTDMCSKFSRLSFAVESDTRNQRNLLPLLPSSFTTSKPVVSTKHAHSPKSFAQGSTDTLRFPFSVSSSLLAPHIFPLSATGNSKWLGPVKRAKQVPKILLAVIHLEAGSVCVSTFGIRLGGEAIKYSSLLARYTVTQHPWPDGYMHMCRHCSINLERLVAYLDLEHTPDA